MAKKKTKKIKEKKVKLGKSKETAREKMIGQHIGCHTCHQVLEFLVTRNVF